MTVISAELYGYITLLGQTLYYKVEHSKIAVLNNLCRMLYFLLLVFYNEGAAVLNF